MHGSGVRAGLERLLNLVECLSDGGADPQSPTLRTTKFRDLDYDGHESQSAWMSLLRQFEAAWIASSRSELDPHFGALESYAPLLHSFLNVGVDVDEKFPASEHIAWEWSACEDVDLLGTRKIRLNTDVTPMTVVQRRIASAREDVTAVEAVSNLLAQYGGQSKVFSSKLWVSFAIDEIGMLGWAPAMIQLGETDANRISRNNSEFQGENSWWHHGEHNEFLKGLFRRHWEKHAQPNLVSN